MSIREDSTFPTPIVSDGKTLPDIFNLENESAYRQWREVKLRSHPENVSDLVVKIEGLADFSDANRMEILRRCEKANMAIYACRSLQSGPDETRRDLLTFAASFGLCRPERHRSASNDGLVAIKVSGDSRRKGYIPYSNKPLSWHTDGYYNAPEDRIGAFILHCVRDADSGGENSFLDPEIAYIRLRDESPAFVAAFMQSEAMTIPANVEGGVITREESIGPVFFVNGVSGRLQMRYTARGRNIVWRDCPDTQAAAKFLAELLTSGDPLIFKHKLEPGQGVICNNVLHSRTGFVNPASQPKTTERLLYRVRYLDPVAPLAVAT